MVLTTHLSTAQVARLCSVAPRTVGKWFDTGALAGQMAVGGRERQYQLVDVMNFMAKHHIPMGQLQHSGRRVGVVGVDAMSASAIRRATIENGYEFEEVSPDLKGGIALACSSPRLVILNVDRVADEAMKAMRDHPRLQLSHFIALAASANEARYRKLKNLGYQDVLTRPITDQTAAQLLRMQLMQPEESIVARAL